MDTGSFKAPAITEIEGVVIKATHIASHNLVELVLRDKTGNLRTIMSGVKALGLTTIRKGANVLAVCESRIAGSTQYINELKTITTHERTGLSLSRIINLDEGDDFDFAGINAPSEEPAAPSAPAAPDDTASKEQE